MSGGQRQNSNCKNNLNNPSLLVLDEATSALDSETETVVPKFASGQIEQFSLLLTGCLQLKIATKYWSDSGDLIESGDHHQLVQNNGIYSILSRQQSMTLE